MDNKLQMTCRKITEMDGTTQLNLIYFAGEFN